MKKALPYILAFAIPFAVYSPTLAGTFYYDDNVIFFGHQVRALAEDPLSVFTGKMHYVPGAPRSIHVFFLLLLYKAFGSNPLPFHAFNLFLHSMTTLLVFIFLKMAIDANNVEKKEEAYASASSLFGSLVFGLHPVHVENITFVTLGGTDLFYTLWAMLSLVLYMRARRSGSKAGYILLLFSAGAFYLSLLSKESAVAFIVVYPLTEIFVIRRWGGWSLPSLLWALPHGILLSVYKKGFIFGLFSSAAVMVGGHGGANGAPPRAGVEDIFKSLGFFVKSLVLPYPHMPFIKEFGNSYLLYSFAVLLVLALIAGLVFRKRLISYSALWIGAVSAPYLFIPFFEFNVAITAERYIYGPSVGFAILSASAASAFGARVPRKVLIYAASAVLIVYSALGINYFFSAWRSEEAFWKYAIKTNPDYVSGYISLSAIEQNRGNVDRAKELLFEGLGRPKGMAAEYSQAAYSLADMARREGDIKRAESFYMLSLRYGPYEFSYIDLGFLFLDTGNLEGAKWAFDGALGFPMQNPRALFGMAVTHQRLGDMNTARAFALQVLERARDERLRALASEIMKN